MPLRSANMAMQPTEAEFSAMVRELAEWHGWDWWHFSDSRRPGPRGRLVGDAGAAGFPDLVLVHPKHGIVFVELKTRKGRLRPKQQEALEAIDAAARPGVKVHLWRPDDVDTVIGPCLRGEALVPARHGWEPQ